jgi:hypothetical protein
MLMAGSRQVRKLSDGYISVEMRQPCLSFPSIMASALRHPRESEGTSLLEEANAMTAPSEAAEIPSLPATSNVLCIRDARHSRHSQTQRQSSSSLFVTFADRSLIEISSSPPYQRFRRCVLAQRSHSLSLPHAGWMSPYYAYVRSTDLPWALRHRYQNSRWTIGPFEIRRPSCCNG